MTLRMRERFKGDAVGPSTLAVYRYPDPKGIAYVLDNVHEKRYFQRTLIGTILDMPPETQLSRVAVLKSPMAGLQISNINCHPILVVSIPPLWVGIERHGKGVLMQVSEKFEDIRQCREGVTRDRHALVAVAVSSITRPGETVASFAEFFRLKDVVRIGRKSDYPDKALAGVLYSRFAAVGRYPWRREARRERRFHFRKRTKHLVIQQRASDSSGEEGLYPEETPNYTGSFPSHPPSHLSLDEGADELRAGGAVWMGVSRRSQRGSISESWTEESMHYRSLSYVTGGLEDQASTLEHRRSASIGVIEE